MVPLEIERPWIKQGLGRRTFAGVMLVTFITFLLIVALNGVGGQTVNVQQINIKFSNSQEPSFSSPYGKFTYSGSSSVLIDVHIKITNNAHFAITQVHAGSPFNARLTSQVNIDGNGDYSIPVCVTMPSQNYAGSLNLTFQ